MNQKIALDFGTDIELYIKRDDLNHPLISGNKLRKLKYNLIEASEKGFSKIVTFGGAFSNHILATAAAGKEFGFETIGVIRGEELINQIDDNPTLREARNLGMKFYFISREIYRNKDSEVFLKELEEKFGSFYLVPEGGTNELAIKGCEEILEEDDSSFDFVCCAVGTGGTISGIINASKTNQKILGFPALKGDFLYNDIRKFVHQNNWDLILDYHFGGYGKIKPELITFLNKFYLETNVPLDPLYNGKMMFGIIDLIAKNYFPSGSKILAIHTGGLQGIKGVNKILKEKNKEIIIYED
ncbi:1-aminocyclopropane-1-carboxylate deaminase/D-cysteine desulfhydrase [Flavobacterium haoranii]|uniref:1-aminocyclopropane-1-carboxylate deaminase n=1 Tax=Flavobacterium haoranii TaxID=683124 RepID=A0A1M6IUV1_9FLAO|nr:pyridoxal-phosphate dependent enzyme [Flavobacterium haoranii]SHJ38207.1 1-aminocyclopropane-1-carboxylate deaminase [Flavobacterium haoranii]